MLCLTYSIQALVTIVEIVPGPFFGWSTGAGSYSQHIRKENGKPGIEESGLYKSHSPEKASKGPWSVDVDHKRAEYHRQKAEESDCLIF